MMDKLRLVSSEDVGRDESNTESLLKKHDVSTLFYWAGVYWSLMLLISDEVSNK